MQYSCLFVSPGEVEDEECHCAAQHCLSRRLQRVPQERRLLAFLECERMRDLLPCQCDGGGHPPGWGLELKPVYCHPQLTYNLAGVAGRPEQRCKWDVLEPHQVFYFILNHMKLVALVDFFFTISVAYIQKSFDS